MLAGDTSAGPRHGRLVAAATVLGCALFGLGLLVGRGARPPASEHPAPTPASLAPARDTAPRRPSRARVPRPTRSGALVAARRILGQMVDERYLGAPAARRALVERIAVPGARRALLRRADRTYGYMRDQLAVVGDSGEAVLRAAPAGCRLEAYDGRRARVAVWAATVLATSAGTQAICTWSTSRLTLRFGARGWRLAGLGVDEPGPAPAQVTSAPASPAAFVARVKAFRGWGK